MAIKQGIGCFIHPTVKIDEQADVTLGDHVYIGEGVRIGAGIFSCGDYCKIHNNCYINPSKFIRLGHLNWFGQGTILDGTGGITAGNYLGVGINSALYSHIRHGDITEGCKFDNNKELVIGDDVWFVGMCLVSPIKASHKSMAMLGSVITKDMLCNTVYGGNPAKKIDKIESQYYLTTVDEKYYSMVNHLSGYSKIGNIEGIEIIDKYPDNLESGVTYYNVSERTYTKLNTENEVNFNKWLFKYKAKFIPK